MQNTVKSIRFSELTLKKCKTYAEERGLTISGAIRVIINEFFLKKER